MCVCVCVCVCVLMTCEITKTLSSRKMETVNRVRISPRVGFAHSRKNKI